MLTYINGKPIAFISLTQPPVPVLEVKQDEMECVIYCPYCGSKTTIGHTLMIGGYVGCNNCYFVQGGLLETVVHLKNSNRHEYVKGDFYRKGFAKNRESIAKKNETTKIYEESKDE